MSDSIVPLNPSSRGGQKAINAEIRSAGKVATGSFNPFRALWRQIDSTLQGIRPAEWDRQRAAAIADRAARASAIEDEINSRPPVHEIILHPEEYRQLRMNARFHTGRGVKYDLPDMAAPEPKQSTTHVTLFQEDIKAPAMGKISAARTNRAGIAWKNEALSGEVHRLSDGRLKLIFPSTKEQFEVLPTLIHQAQRNAAPIIHKEVVHELQESAHYIAQQVNARKARQTLEARNAAAFHGEMQKMEKERYEQQERAVAAELAGHDAELARMQAATASMRQAQWQQEYGAPQELVMRNRAADAAYRQELANIAAHNARQARREEARVARAARMAQMKISAAENLDAAQQAVAGTLRQIKNTVLPVKAPAQASLRAPAEREMGSLFRKAAAYAATGTMLIESLISGGGGRPRVAAEKEVGEEIVHVLAKRPRPPLPPVAQVAEAIKPAEELSARVTAVAKPERVAAKPVNELAPEIVERAAQSSAPVVEAVKPAPELAVRASEPTQVTVTADARPVALEDAPPVQPPVVPQRDAAPEAPPSVAAKAAPAAFRPIVESVTTPLATPDLPPVADNVAVNASLPEVMPVASVVRLPEIPASQIPSPPGNLIPSPLPDFLVPMEANALFTPPELPVAASAVVSAPAASAPVTAADPLPSSPAPAAQEKALKPTAALQQAAPDKAAATMPADASHSAAPNEQPAAAQDKPSLQEKKTSSLRKSSLGKVALVAGAAAGTGYALHAAHKDFTDRVESRRARVAEKSGLAFSAGSNVSGVVPQKTLAQNALRAQTATQNPARSVA